MDAKSRTARNGLGNPRVRRKAKSPASQKKECDRNKTSDARAGAEARERMAKQKFSQTFFFGPRGPAVSDASKADASAYATPSLELIPNSRTPRE